MRLNGEKQIAQVARLLVMALLATLWQSDCGAAEPATLHGQFSFAPADDEAHVVPAPFQLPTATVDFEQQPQLGASDQVQLSLVTFPSPVNTPYPENNTVHCEYFRPAAPGKHPAVVVLHILGGDFPLSRTFATALAHRNVAALFVIMPYYGPRRPTGANVRMVSTDPRQTVAGMTQAIKDIRYAAAWLASREEVDPARLGVFGVSLGGITSALAGEAEPRFKKICPVLAGGGIQEVLWDSHEPHIAEARRHWEAAGQSRDSLAEIMKAVDPCSYGQYAKGRQILMLNANRDEVIPKRCSEALWRSLGEPTIRWYDAGHYTAMFRIADAIDQVTRFFADDAK